MKRPWKLSRLLIVSHAGLALVLGLLLLASAAHVVRASLQDRAQAQATQSGIDALARLQDQQRDVAVTAELLAQRPTLQAQLAGNRRNAATGFLEAFARTAGVDAIQVERGGEAFASVGTPTSLPQRDGLHEDARGQAWIVQSRPLPGPVAGRVVVADRLAESVLRGSEPDIRLQLLPVSAIQGARAASLRADRLASYRHVVTTRAAEDLRDQGDVAALRVQPVLDGNGEVRALLLASVPGELVARSTLRWLSGLALGSLVGVLLAAWLATWIARRIAQPFDELADAGHRLGLGDLATPVKEPAADLAEARSLARSLEQMRQQVRALAESERRQRQELDAVLEGVGDGVVAVDAAGLVRYANRQFLELVGQAEAEVLGQPFDQVVVPAPADGVPIIEAVTDPLATARRHGVAEGRVRAMLRGRPRGLVIRSSAPPGGRQVAMVREESSTEAARSMRDAILANLSHEFQTPLAVQLASIELLQDHLDQHPDGIARELVDAQYRGALRLSLLVDNLLDSVRLESGEMKLRDEPIDPVALVTDAVDLMAPLLQQREQRVALDLPPGRRRLRGDGQRLAQVMVNLLANANKFAPDRSSIRVELVWGERTVSLWVEDEGPGLPPLRRRADLFAPFRRSPDQEPSQRGSGLGLAIVRAMVERHQGEVVVADPRNGQGARFGIVLPLEEEA